MAREERIIWITGASSGIGYSLTSKLLAQGNTIIATARHTERLEELRKSYPKSLHTFELDVSLEPAVHQFCLHLKQHFAYIDTMILNAGICEYLEWPELNLETMHHNMNTNFWGVVNCVKHGMTLLQDSNDPYIVATSSAVQILGLPRAEGYGASKAALHYFLQTLQVELYNSKTKLSIVTPGFVKTELTSKNDFAMPFLVSVDKASDIILKGMQKKKYEIAFPCSLILIMKLIRLFPSALRVKILSKIIRSK